MYKWCAEQLLTTCRPTPSQSLSSDPPTPTPPVSILDVTSHGMEYPVGQFGSGALAVSCANFLCPSSSLAGWAWEAEKNPWLQTKHYLAATDNISVTNILLILNSKHSTVPATRKTINSIPAETRTDRNIFVWNSISARPSSLAQIIVLIMSNRLDVSSDCLKEEEDRRIRSYFWLASAQKLGFRCWLLV